MQPIRSNPTQGLTGATIGFFFGAAAVSLFGASAVKFRDAMGLSPLEVGILVGMPSLSGALLRIPFSAWVDTTGGRKPFLTLLVLSVIGMLGLTGIVNTMYPNNLPHGMFPVLLLFATLGGCGIAAFSVGAGQVAYWFPKARLGTPLALFGGVGNLAPGLYALLTPIAIAKLGLGGTYASWLALLLAGAFFYWRVGTNAWYFQYREQGMAPEVARRLAGEAGQELFPAGDLKTSLRESASSWRTWALVFAYFTTYGGFLGLTAWFPTYWTQYFDVTPIGAGILTATFSLLTSSIRIVGGVLSDRLREGGENTAILGYLIMMAGALVMSNADQYELAIPGAVLLGFGMGICTAAVFKMVPQAAPNAVGGTVGWVGGLGALGGFLLPPVMAFAVSDLGKRGYAIGFIVFIYLCLASLATVWVMKYMNGVPGTQEHHEQVARAEAREKESVI